MSDKETKPWLLHIDLRGVSVPARKPPPVEFVDGMYLLEVDKVDELPQPSSKHFRLHVNCMVLKAPSLQLEGVRMSDSIEVLGRAAGWILELFLACLGKEETWKMLAETGGYPDVNRLLGRRYWAEVKMTDRFAQVIGRNAADKYDGPYRSPGR